MIEPLHVLLVADSAAGTHAALDALRRVGYDPRPRFAASREALGVALSERDWDAILVESDALGAPIDAVSWAYRQQPETPVIVLGEPAEPIALVHAGASELLAASQLGRLGAIIAKARRARAATPEAGASSFSAHLPLGFYRTTSDGRILYANAALAQLLGRESVEELMACDIRRDFSYPRDTFEALIAGEGEVRDLEVSWTHPDGRAVVTREYARAVRDAQGGLLYYEGFMEDVTSERDALQRERERARQLESVVRCGSELHAASTLDELYRAAVRKVEAALEADVVFIQRVDGADRQVVAWSDAVSGELVRACESSFVPDDPEAVGEIISLCDPLRAFGIAIAYTFPLRFRGQTVGALVAAFSTARALGDGDRRMGAALGWHVAAAIGRWEAERTAIAHEAALRSMGEATGHVLYRHRFGALASDYVSDSIEELTGYSAASLCEQGGFRSLIEQTQTLAGTVPPDGRLEIVAAPFHALHRIRTRSGELRWVEDRTYPWCDESGETVGIVGVLMDVTAREHQQAAERERQQRLLDQQRALLQLSALSLPSHEFIQRATETAADLLGVGRAAVWMVDSANEGFRCADLYCLDSGEHASEAPVRSSELGLGEETFENHRVYAVDDLEGEDAEAPGSYYRRHATRAIAAAPIRRQGRMEGVVLFEHAGAPRLWTDDEREFAAALADLLALAFEREDRWRTERALRRSEQRYRAVSELASDYAYAVRVGADGQTFPEWATRAFERITGYPLSEFSTHAELVRAMVHPEDQAHALAEMERLTAGETVEFTARIVTRAGEERWVRHRARPVREPGGKVGYVYASGQDVTERVRFEHALREAKERAEADRARAEESTQLKGAFVASMSHEIRTPLTSLIGFAEVLAEDVGEEHRQFADLIAAGGRRLLDTLNSVLDLARLESGEVRVEPVDIDLVREVRQTVDLLQPLANEKQLNLRLEAPATLPLRIDRGSLGRVLTNLIGNAIKFTEEGEVTVTVHAEADDVVVQVADTGIGMDESFLPYLFDEFKRAPEGEKRNNGSGLGLTITDRLVELMQGMIEVESTKGEGTTFTVRLPLVPPEQSLPAEGPPAPAAEAKGDDAALDAPAYTVNVEIAPVLAETTASGSDDASLEPPPGDPEGAAALHSAEEPVWGDCDWKEIPEVEDDTAGQESDVVMPVPVQEPARVRGDDSSHTVTLAEPVPPALSTVSAGADLAPPARLLVVEDNPDARQLLLRALRAHYAVEAVPDARSALERMSREAFDVLVLDIHLGGKQTGADILRIARTLPGYDHIVAVAVTAYAVPGDREKLLEAGFDGYVSKPFTMQALLDTLAKVGVPAAVRS